MAGCKWRRETTLARNSEGTHQMATPAPTATQPRVLRIEIKGPPDKELVTKLDTATFRRALSGFLFEAGIRSSVTVRACTMLKGTPHTKGLKLKAPDQHSVELTWHEGSNDECILFRITTPSGIEGVVDVISFDKRLRDTAAAIKNRKEEARAAKRERQDSPTNAAQSNGPPDQKFSMQPDMVVLLIEEVFTAGLIDERGYITRRKLAEIVCSPPFGYPSAGVVFTWLINMGHFKDAEAQDFLELGNPHKEKYMQTPADSGSGSGPAQPAAATEKSLAQRVDEYRAQRGNMGMVAFAEHCGIAMTSLRKLLNSEPVRGNALERVEAVLAGRAVQKVKAGETEFDPTFESIVGIIMKDAQSNSRLNDLASDLFVRSIKEKPAGAREFVEGLLRDYLESVPVDKRAATLLEILDVVKSPKPTAR